jgi:hypothetical protein
VAVPHPRTEWRFEEAVGWEVSAIANAGSSGIESILPVASSLLIHHDELVFFGGIHLAARIFGRGFVELAWARVKHTSQLEYQKSARI